MIMLGAVLAFVVAALAGFGLGVYLAVPDWAEDAVDRR